MFFPVKKVSTNGKKIGTLLDPCLTYDCITHRNTKKYNLQGDHVTIEIRENKLTLLLQKKQEH